MHSTNRLLSCFAVIMLCAPAARAEDRQAVLVVVGAAGAEEYGESFSTWAARWKQAAEQADAGYQSIGEGEEAESNDHDLLQQKIAELAKSPPQAVWLVLIGHGTFDGKTAKFNLRGPDVSSEELAAWLKPLEAPLAIVNCASASGPFINALSGANRVVISATKSGYEHNFARFGDHFSRAITDEAADLDKDGQTSLLEAFLAASAATQEFYQQESRLATEHALLDDTGDALGTPADWFQGYRAVKSAKDGALPDGSRANQFVLLRRGQEASMPSEIRQRRDALELQVEALRQKKPSLSEDEYYTALEPLLVEIARLYAELEAKPAEQTEPARQTEASEPSGQNGRQADQEP